MSGIDNIHERCGIMTVCLTDPLSQLISKIMGLREDEANSVGFYYEAELHGVSKCTVILFNIYDNDPVPWLRLGYTMELLLASPFVTKINFYPLVTNQSDSSSSLMSRATMSKRSISKRLEDMFRTVVVETISTNAGAIHDKNISYTALLLKIAGITGEDADRLTIKIITGYSLVNRVLLTLMGIRQSDLSKISSSIIPCPLLRTPVSIIAPREQPNESDIKYVIEESRREITKLVAIFVDLFTSHELFRSNILATRLVNYTTDGNRSSMGSVVNLDSLFSLENELVSHIVGGIQNGIISNSTLNDIIRDISDERFSLANQVPGYSLSSLSKLPISINPNKNVQVTTDTMMCTFQQPVASTMFTNTDPLKDLGLYISHIVDSFTKPDALTINLGGIIGAYNNAIKGTDLDKISIPKLNTDVSKSGVNGAHTLSRQAIVTIPGDPNGDNILIPINSKAIPVPMYNGNLSSLSQTQLLDILVYIDSLRDSNGTGDTRFANLQNEITHELAQRTRNSSH